MALNKDWLKNLVRINLLIKFEKCNINELCADKYQRTFEAMSPERKSKVERLKMQEDKRNAFADNIQKGRLFYENHLE